MRRGMNHSEISFSEELNDRSEISFSEERNDPF